MQAGCTSPRGSSPRRFDPSRRRDPGGSARRTSLSSSAMRPTQRRVSGGCGGRASRRGRSRRRPNGCSTTSTWSTSEIRDIRQHLPRTYYRQLPTLASREHAGHAADLRDGRRAGPPQRQPARSPAARAVPQQLPARRAADDRRALGVAEHAEAGADREPAAAGRGDCSQARAARLRRRRLRRRGSTSEPASAGALPPDTDTGLRRPAAAPHPRVRAAAVVGPRRGRRAPRLAGRRPRKRRSAASTSAQARRRRCRWPTPSPACASARRSTGASTSSRSAWSSRCCSAIPPARTGGWTS